MVVGRIGGNAASDLRIGDRQSHREIERRGVCHMGLGPWALACTCVEPGWEGVHSVYSACLVSRS